MYRTNASVYRIINLDKIIKNYKPDYSELALRVLAAVWFFGSIGTAVTWHITQEEYWGSVFLGFLAMPLWLPICGVVCVVFGYIVVGTLMFIFTGEFPE